MRKYNKIILFCLLLTQFTYNGLCQNSNQIDSLGRKQGFWSFEVRKDTIVGFNQPYVSCYYVNDTLDGEYNITGLNSPKFSLNYKMGKKDGVQKLYDNNMILSEIQFYNKGEILSKFYFYDIGTIEEEETYKNGLLNGVCRTYYRKGKPWMIKTYKDGQLNGNYIHLDKKGKIFMIEEYEKGILKNIKKY